MSGARCRFAPTRRARSRARRLPPATLPLRVLLLGAAAATGAACSGDASGPRPRDAVVGSYAAVEWTITSATESFDVLAAGGHLTLALHADGTTDGEFYIPAGAAPEPQEQRVSMAGTWRLEEGVVRFTMDGDTYVRFVDWQVGDGTLSTSFANGGWTVSTVLHR